MAASNYFISKDLPEGKQRKIYSGNFSADIRKMHGTKKDLCAGSLPAGLSIPEYSRARMRVIVKNFGPREPHSPAVKALQNASAFPRSPGPSQ